ncbi:hypothetical protein BDY19DRAFT_635737 [Irpex rosettiformis]|uniref:Uncharacterized protein n=1 Tax=Irpex rosettiformis TaxID=378272 RepID=A0ACB8UBI3_9APHY|nr:hypothetical protein BDY19DRAFT_635737 [Irpex rosettiformis]
MEVALLGLEVSLRDEFWSNAFSGAPFHSRPARPSSNITLLSSSITVSITNQTTVLSTASIPGATTTTTALPQSSHTTRIPNGAIAGIVVGIILLLLSFVAIIVFLRRRARKLEKVIISETRPEPYMKIEDRDDSAEVNADMHPSLTTPELTLPRSKRPLRHPSPTSQESTPSSPPLHPSPEGLRNTV